LMTQGGHGVYEDSDEDNELDEFLIDPSSDPILTWLFFAFRYPYIYRLNWTLYRANGLTIPCQTKDEADAKWCKEVNKPIGEEQGKVVSWRPSVSVVTSDGETNVWSGDSQHYSPIDYSKSAGKAAATQPISAAVVQSADKTSVIFGFGNQTVSKAMEVAAKTAGTINTKLTVRAGGKFGVYFANATTLKSTGVKGKEAMLGQYLTAEQAAALGVDVSQYNDDTTYQVMERTAYGSNSWNNATDYKVSLTIAISYGVSTTTSTTNLGYMSSYFTGVGFGLIDTTVADAAAAALAAQTNQSAGGGVSHSASDGTSGTVASGGSSSSSSPSGSHGGGSSSSSGFDYGTPGATSHYSPMDYGGSSTGSSGSSSSSGSSTSSSSGAGTIGYGYSPSLE
jgi:hypothetical protein